MTSYLKQTCLLLVAALLCMLPADADAQQLRKDAASIEIKGIVKDEKGDPIIGATVVAKNQPGLGATTDVDGKFHIKVLAVAALSIEARAKAKVNSPTPEHTCTKVLISPIKTKSETMTEEAIITAS